MSQRLRAGYGEGEKTLSQEVRMSLVVTKMQRTGDQRVERSGTFAVRMSDREK